MKKELSTLQVKTLISLEKNFIELKRKKNHITLIIAFLFVRR